MDTLNNNVNNRDHPTDVYSTVTPSYRRCACCKGEGYIGEYYRFHTCTCCGGVGIVLVAPTVTQEEGKKRWP